MVRNRVVSSPSAPAPCQLDNSVTNWGGSGPCKGQNIRSELKNAKKPEAEKAINAKHQMFQRFLSSPTGGRPSKKG
ncbi:hypothetical protein, partial [Qipengyuania mesophila]|uniref:hypothetical protein n=1 Tax=Qipengyuania mesophila TaxID=2867246 RepID=UPI00355A40BA